MEPLVPKLLAEGITTRFPPRFAPSIFALTGLSLVRVPLFPPLRKKRLSGFPEKWSRATCRDSIRRQDALIFPNHGKASGGGLNHHGVLRFADNVAFLTLMECDATL